MSSCVLRVSSFAFVVLLAVLVLGSPGGGMSAGQEERYRNPIVFQRAHMDEATGKPRLMAKVWVMEEDGSRLRQLTHGETYDDHPSFFSDRRSILYSEYPVNAEDRNSSPKLIKMDLYTGQREVFHEVKGHALHHASVSPIGDLVGYSRDLGTKRLSFWVGVGADAYEVPTPALNGFALPDGAIYMLEKNRGISPREVSIARLWRTPSGFQVTFITDDKALNRRPAISPDGKLLAWQTNRAGGRDEIFLAGVDGSNPRNLTQTPRSHEGHPWFSRDGKWVIFESDRVGDYEVNACDRRVACEVYKQHVETGEVVQLTSGGKAYVSHRARM
jgi:hypothetical protein